MSEHSTNHPTYRHRQAHSSQGYCWACEDPICGQREFEPFREPEEDDQWDN